MNDNMPRGALMVVGVVFVTIMLLWFLVLGVIQGRV
jgi:K+ transporter